MESREQHIVNEVAFRCGDESFKNFPKHHYYRVYQRVIRQISRKYKLDKRIYTFKNVIQEGEIPIELPNFISPVSLYVNNEEYQQVVKIDYDSKKNQYYLFRDFNKLHFSYYPRSEEDKLELTYIADITITDDYIDDVKPIIPEQYNEEIITHCIIEMCKLGISKYTGEEGNKYAALLRLYNANIKEYDQNLIKKEGWVVIKPKWVV